MNIQNQEQWEEAFINACEKGHLDDVRHLCEKQYLDLGWANIHIHDEEGFRWACYYGRLDVIKYLLTSHELIEAGHTFADLHACNDDGFRWACYSGQLDVVKYLLTSKELKEVGHSFANVHDLQGQGFFLACRGKHWDVVRWLIMDYGLEKTPAIEEMIQDHPKAQEYFRVQEELQAIQGVLQNHSSDNLRGLSNERSDEWAAKKMKKL